MIELVDTMRALIAAGGLLFGCGLVLRFAVLVWIGGLTMLAAVLALMAVN